MNTEKQTVAEAIKRLATELEQQLVKAQQVGLTVELVLPSRYTGAAPTQVQVAVFERVAY